MFQVPVRTQYAIRALVHLARRPGESSARIAEAEGISPKYLEGILAQLKASGLVGSERGRMGGYRLLRDPALVAMSEVVRSMEGDVMPVGCIDGSSMCAKENLCIPRRFWLGLKNAVDGYLSSVSLGELAAGESLDGREAVRETIGE